jgi:histidyl-tRNA synthetase
MKIPPVKGTRDFYPPQMAVRNFILDGWKAASLRNGYEEYDGPIFEHLQMYQIKSGDEIVEQLFSLTDRGGRELAIRPEITPTLARMVNQQINSLPRPIKWFSLPRLCRAERPQKGRLREFFQWNIDIIGIDDVLADAEVIFTTLDYLRSVGLTAKDIQARISSRKLLAQLLKNICVPANRLDFLYPVLDKKGKMPAEAFEATLKEKVGDAKMVETILKLMEVDSPEHIADVVDLNAQAQAALNEVRRTFELLETMGVADYCTFDMSIVRGLAYYTGIVFEVHDITGDLRAVCGGGRYDNLLKDFGGPSIPATGMGMGDCILEILLRQKGLLKDDMPTQQTEFFVACVGDKYYANALETAAKIRLAGHAAAFSYKAAGLGKQLKQASAQGARQCIIIGQEFAAGELVVKDMATGEQSNVKLADFLSSL